MNPRAAINDLHPFQGCPFGQLGYFSMLQNSDTLLSFMHRCRIPETEKVGFEPTVPFGITGFQDQLLKPLGHLSASVLNSACMILAKFSQNVNRLFYFFSLFYFNAFSVLVLGKKTFASCRSSGVVILIFS